MVKNPKIGGWYNMYINGRQRAVKVKAVRGDIVTVIVPGLKWRKLFSHFGDQVYITRKSKLYNPLEMF